METERVVTHQPQALQPVHLLPWFKLEGAMDVVWWDGAIEGDNFGNQRPATFAHILGCGYQLGDILLDASNGYEGAFAPSTADEALSLEDVEGVSHCGSGDSVNSTEFVLRRKGIGVFRRRGMFINLLPEDIGQLPVVRYGVSLVYDIQRNCSCLERPTWYVVDLYVQPQYSTVLAGCQSLG